MHVDIGEAFSFVSPCRHSYKQKIMLYAFFWVIPRRLNFMCRRFGTLSHLHRQVPPYEDGRDRKFEFEK